MSNEYSKADIEKAAVFMTRMMPFLAQGMTFEEAGNALLMRDYELRIAATATNEQGETIRQALAAQVYGEICK